MPRPLCQGHSSHHTIPIMTLLDAAIHVLMPQNPRCQCQAGVLTAGNCMEQAVT